MNQIPRLKKCPFCGSDDCNYGAVEQTEANSWHVQILCNSCDAQVSSAYASSSPEQAVRDAAEKWNERPDANEGVAVPLTEAELVGLIRKKCRCEINFTRPDQDTVNLNEYGQPNRLNPITSGRANYTVTLDQDAIELLAKVLMEAK